MKRTLAVLVAVAAVGWIAVATQRPTEVGPRRVVVDPVVKPAPQPLVQIALLLDTSGSMDGLIDQARNQLWTLVNELGTARKGGVAPRLELAVYEYGKSTVPGEIRQVTPFTTDLDNVSAALFGLTTNGGNENCGEVIARSVQELEWSSNPDVLKLVYIAGNESFMQGPVPPAQAIAQAREKGISVNVIHCGGVDASWQQGAMLAGTQFMSIDHNQRVVVHAAPQDAELARLNQQLNDTYVPFGAGGSVGRANQAAQDKNAHGVSASTLATRAMSKASKLYDASKWDLVDAVEKKKVDLSKAEKEALPEELRELDEAGRKQWVAQKKAQREEIKTRIAQLGAERQKHVEAAAPAAAPSLDSAMLDSVRAQSMQKGFEFGK